MKYIWEADDIIAGVFFHRGDLGECGASNLHKIGRFHYHPDVDVDQIKREKKFMGVAMSDGQIFTFGDGSAEDFAKKLNEGNYVPTTHKQLIKLVENNPSMIAREVVK